MTIKITLQSDGPISLNAEGEDFPLLKTIAGEDIEIKEPVFLCRCGASQNKPFCDWAHAGEGYSDKNVCDNDSEDWIHPEEASVEEVIDTVRKCPSGALTFTVDGKTEVKQEGAVSIRIVKNGPYQIKGPVVFDSPIWSRNASKSSFALCRCGKSGNIPFCDYSHGEQGWDDSQ